MVNIKGFAIANDGSMKRIAVTYDEIDDDGKIINGNQKVNRVITDETVNDAAEVIADYAQAVIEG